MPYVAVGVGVRETLGVGKDVELAEGEPDEAGLAGDAQAAARMTNTAAARKLTNFRTFSFLLSFSRGPVTRNAPPVPLRDLQSFWLNLRVIINITLLIELSYFYFSL